MTSVFRLALVQLAGGSDKAGNLKRAAEKVKEAARNGAQVVSLPECFNSPYGTKYFHEYAEEIPYGESCQVMKETAKEHEVYLIGGSIPEIDGHNIFNTSTVWSPTGELIQTHRKMHLFDINIPGKITFKESEVLSPGNKLSTFDTPFCRIGLGICYDIRFADMAQIYARNYGCKLLVYPGAFNMTTGKAHWTALARARALDNQLYVASVSPARDESADYIAWGHSLVIDPFGDVVAQAGPAEEIIFADIDLDRVAQVRDQIPITKQRREDVYEVREVK